MISRILTHLTFIISMMLMTFIILDRFNPTMSFMNNNITSLIIIIYVVINIINAILLIVKNTNKKNKKVETL